MHSVRLTIWPVLVLAGLVVLGCGQKKPEGPTYAEASAIEVQEEARLEALRAKLKQLDEEYQEASRKLTERYQADLDKINPSQEGPSGDSAEGKDPEKKPLIDIAELDKKSEALVNANQAYKNELARRFDNQRMDIDREIAGQERRLRRATRAKELAAEREQKEKARTSKAATP